MGRKAGMETNKREDILIAAQSCFMEQGFDGTSVRTIMKQAGAEIGLFYYYFKNKDDAYNQVLDRFFAGYEADFAQIVRHGRRNPCRIMEDFFEYMERETAAFREKYANNMHRTVRWAIREHTLTLIEPYLLQVVEIQSAYYGVQPPIAPPAAALYLTHGVASAILHEDSETYFGNRSEIKRGVSLLMGMPLEQQSLRIPERAAVQDIPAWMELVSMMQEQYPGLDEAEYKKKLIQHIECNEAWLFRNGKEVVAAMLYSKQEQEIEFLAVHPAYQRHGLAQKLVETAAAQFPVGTKLSVVTYRKDDPKGIEAYAFYQAMGFVPQEKLMVFDYPCQRMMVTAADAPLGHE